MRSLIINIVIDKKKYVLISIEEYEKLQLKAVLNSKTPKLLSFKDAKIYSKSLVKSWSKNNK